MSRALLGVSLLLCVGCAGVQTVQPMADSSLPTTSVAFADEEEDHDKNFLNWIPNIFYDLWDTIDADIGAGYGFGMHLKVTNFLRVGVFDYSDFGVLGVEREIWEGVWIPPWEPADAEPGDLDAILDLSAQFGIGFGAGFTLHTWQVVDLLSTIVGFGYWSLEND